MGGSEALADWVRTTQPVDREPVQDVAARRWLPGEVTLVAALTVLVGVGAAYRLGHASVWTDEAEKSTIWRGT